ncbi:hypothetical protein PRZ48_013488 [Zasmidium cellare]|uniref:F-box domain-containing protein n=1 Tax=Zasmidium cellare TaxID=395010 RepID=A0ABR0E1T2_ZASCE|nr:hypothetical protein PRZ48_013488 [Zasmidium cellare]
MRQSTLNFDGCAPALRDDSDDESVNSDFSGHTTMMNDDYMCICSREGCDYEDDPESCNCNVCWEDRIDKDGTLCAVRSGFFHHHHESAFYGTVWEHPQWDTQFLEYYDEDCKPKVLKQFVRQRGLVDAFPGGVTLKYFYIKELLASDSVRMFRFLDLPAELRNEVYGYLLAPRSHYYRESKILRTCKQIHEEATEVLYADNVISCTFSHRQDHVGRIVRINHTHHQGERAFEYAQLPTAMDLYPDFLARIRHLKIDIHVDITRGAGSAVKNSIVDFVRSGLLALASVVMDGGRLKTLNVDVGSNTTIEADVVASMLYPLRRLRNINATIGGTVQMPDFLRDDIVAEMRLTDPVFNTLKHCRLVLSNAEAYLKLVDFLDPLPYDKPQRMGNSRAAQIARQVRYLQNKMMNRRTLFADWLGEVKVQTHLAKIQKQLEDVFPDKVREMVGSIGKTSTDREAYQQTEHQRWTIGDLARAKSPSPDPAPL